MNTLIIADDHQIFRDSLIEILSKQGFKIVGTAANGAQLLKLLENTKPDLVITDISMPEMDGCEAAQKSLQKYPDLKILTLSSFGDEKYYYQMVAAGVKGFVLKNSGINELHKAIVEIINGGSWFSNELLQKVITSFKKKTETNVTDKFSERELEVLHLICRGLHIEQIATDLNISTDSVKAYRNDLLTITKCSNVPALVMYAIRNKIIEVK